MTSLRSHRCHISRAQLLLFGLFRGTSGACAGKASREHREYLAKFIKLCRCDSGCDTRPSAAGLSRLRFLPAYTGAAPTVLVIPAGLAYPRPSDTISAAQAPFSGSGTREWPHCPTRAGWPKGVLTRAFCRRMVHETVKALRKSLLRRPRSGRRCDGSQGNPRSQCAADRAYCDLRENYKMTAGPGSRGKVRACVPPTRERVHEISRHADVQPESGKSVVFGRS